MLLDSEFLSLSIFRAGGHCMKSVSYNWFEDISLQLQFISSCRLNVQFFFHMLHVPRSTSSNSSSSCWSQVIPHCNKLSTTPVLDFFRNLLSWKYSGGFPTRRNVFPWELHHMLFPLFWLRGILIHFSNKTQIYLFLRKWFCLDSLLSGRQLFFSITVYPIFFPYGNVPRKLTYLEASWKYK